MVRANDTAIKPSECWRPKQEDTTSSLKAKHFHQDSWACQA